MNSGQTLSIICVAVNNDATRTLTFRLAGAPIGATITPMSGFFSWRPLVSEANTTNVVQVQVTDDSMPPLSASQSFTVVVNSLTPASLTPIGFSNGRFSMMISGPAGPDYVVLRSTNLFDWSALSTNFSPVLPFNFSDLNVGDFSRQFYRLRVGP